MTSFREISNGFKRGFAQLNKETRKTFIRELEAILGVNSTIQIKRYINGDVKLKVDKCEKIEDLFAKYGISEFWGELK